MNLQKADIIFKMQLNFLKNLHENKIDKNSLNKKIHNLFLNELIMDL